MTELELASLAMFLIFAGFAMLVLSMFLGLGDRASGGGVVLLGPFPIVFGSDAKAARLALLAALVMLLAILAIYAYWWLG